MALGHFGGFGRLRDGAAMDAGPSLVTTSAGTQSREGGCRALSMAAYASLRDAWLESGAGATLRISKGNATAGIVGNPAALIHGRPLM